ncbi:MAG: Ig-like domain-containing protein [Lachnospiraceae bacterium]|nr:Ig-like domain-containing protein [Lachnospiraceae bacterium]
MDIIEEIFPKDKIIFLMCGGGGYAGMTKNFLISLGWDETKIYVVGGYWYYHGEHDIKVKKEVNGVVTYDFENVPYHNIDFDMLTKTSNYKAPYVKVSDMKLNTENTTIEEGNSFQLSCIVLPNEATNKGVTWKSDNETVATVTDTGLVKAIKRGYATITVKSDDCGQEKYIYVEVKRKKPTDKVKLDDISSEVKEFNANDPADIYADYSKIGYDDEGNRKEGYFVTLPNGDFTYTELYNKEADALNAEAETMLSNQINVFNKLVDDKKTFVLCVEHYTDCGDSEDKVAKSAKKILNDNNIECLFTTSDNYQLFDNASIDIRDSSSIFVISNGKVYAAEDKSVDSMRDDEEIMNWLKNYIIF